MSFKRGVRVAARPESGAQLEKRLTALDRDELLPLLRDLCQRSSDNRRFVAARLDGACESTLAEYRQRIEAEFAATDPPRAPRLRDARKAIRDYRSATGDRDGAVELLFAFIEAGTRFGCEYDELGDTYYRGLANALRELATVLRAESSWYSRWRNRLAALRRDSHRANGTWGEHVDTIVDQLERKVGPG